MSGYVGLVGGFTLAALMIGWGAIFTAALSAAELIINLAATELRRRSRRAWSSMASIIWQVRR